MTPDKAAATMRAVRHLRYDDAPEVALELGEVPRPEVSEGEVLVRVRAASVDRGTWHLMAGVPYLVRAFGFGVRRPTTMNPALSLAGVVEAVGSGVTGLAPGDRVYGTGSSTLAELALAKPAKLAPMPESLTFAEAAAIPVSGLTALQAVRDQGKLAAGERVLITGASGGVGSFAVPIAKAAGAEVTGVASTAKLAAVRELGADHVVDYTATDPLVGERRYDVILDIAGNASLRRLRRALTPRGRLVIVGGEDGGRWLGGIDRQLRASLLSPFVSQSLGFFVSSENSADLRALTELVDSGVIRPQVSRNYPLAETTRAIRDLLDGRVTGKAVVTIDDGASR